jgi:hypothetical protein
VGDRDVLGKGPPGGKEEVAYLLGGLRGPPRLARRAAQDLGWERVAGLVCPAARGYRGGANHPDPNDPEAALGLGASGEGPASYGYSFPGGHWAREGREPYG